MFSGIVEEIGCVVSAGSGVLRLACQRVRRDAALGDSISVSGVDLTVACIQGNELAFDVMPETYRCTNLAALRSGARANLERSVSAQTRMSGHLVRGVVEGTCVLRARREDGPAVVMTYEVAASLAMNVIARGPVCLDGVSLTVTERTPTEFSVSLVKYTQEHTTLLQAPIGSEVNLETDILMRYVASVLAAKGLVSEPTREEPFADTLSAWEAILRCED